ncbi:hypothetical protein T265_02632 [Opisthorchis viverrini]|uniref:Uncharacterized protein n=1 Tax=Opisthorchis viverrini TaxID=6198 RepID=A0A075AI60_OPIVI|nr:hypothetical protein T265_02632 [Opisthorchis viverrini]KER31069.1 hypothetical protein T265_02632 [Opisthorchis viverrini]
MINLGYCWVRGCRPKLARAMRSYLPPPPNHRRTKLRKLQPLYDEYAVLTADNDDDDEYGGRTEDSGMHASKVEDLCRVTHLFCKSDAEVNLNYRDEKHDSM